MVIFYNIFQLFHVCIKCLFFEAKLRLVEIKEDKYSWVEFPKVVWEALGPQLVSIVLEEKAETPDVIAKNRCILQ